MSDEGKAGRGTESLDRDVRGAAVRRFRLRVIEGPDQGAQAVSRGERLVLGSQEGVDLTLHDSTVSRFHAEVQVLDDRVLLRDLGSRNGTLVGPVPVRECYLLDGAVISVGRSRLLFQIDSEYVPVPAADALAFGRLWGRSVAMRRVFAQLERAAQSRSTVLLTGETGTGKELAAESLHEGSDRANGPFLVVDCAALPATLLESELFGHEKGAFTDARSAREGAFEAASGGTLFLDELGELPIDLQPKLLRAIERREIRRLGANHPTSVDVRIVAATHRDLRVEVNAHRFRADLYYRLAVVEVQLPPLRQRPEDIPLLVERLLAGLDEGPAFAAAGAVDAAFLAELTAHQWPGNVRELRNYLERCTVLRERSPLPPADAPAGPLPIDAKVPLRAARERWVATFERAYLQQLLTQSGGNVTAAARAAGVERVHLYRLLWRHGLR